MTPPDPDIPPLIDLWSDAVEYARQPKAFGGNWTCTLHMRDAENIIIGEGWTREGAERDALEKAGKLTKRRRLPTWPLSALALTVAVYAGIEASLTGNTFQIVASVVASLTAIRLILMRV